MVGPGSLLTRVRWAHGAPRLMHDRASTHGRFTVRKSSHEASPHLACLVLAMDRPEREPEPEQRVRGALAGGGEVDRLLVLAGGLFEVAASEVRLPDPELSAGHQRVGRILVDEL